MWALSAAAVPLYYLYRLPVVGKLLSLALPISMEPDWRWRWLDTFDWYTPTYQWKYLYPEIFRWFRDNGFDDVEIFDGPIRMSGGRTSRESISDTNSTHNDWWRPDGRREPRRTGRRAAASRSAAWSRSPPSCCWRRSRWFPVLKVLRIALLAAGVAIVAHMFDSTVRRRPVVRSRREIGITLDAARLDGAHHSVLVLARRQRRRAHRPVSEGVVFFWLIGTLVTTRAAAAHVRLDAGALLDPLAAMIGLQHFRSGDFLYTGVAARADASPATAG